MSFRQSLAAVGAFRSSVPPLDLDGDGLAAELTVKSTKYYKNKDLN
jgi:hypothetical protein